MNIRDLESRIAEIGETAVIGKAASIDGTVLEIPGLVRIGERVRLVALLYDEEWRDRQEAREADGPVDAGCLQPTLRERLRAAVDDRMPNPVHSAAEIRIGDRSFTVSCVETTRISPLDGETMVLVSRFLEAGWKPAGIGEPDMTSLFLSRFEFEGSFERIPEIPPDPPIRLALRGSGTPGLVEMPLHLTIGDGPFERVVFTDSGTGDSHWMQIHRVYLLDMREQISAIFSSEEAIGRMTPEQLADLRARFEENLDISCPRGMRYPVIEYECEEGISMQFHSRAALDAVPLRTQGAHSTGILVGSPGGTGALGTRLKSAAVQDPVPAGTVQIEAELFQFVQETVARDITLD
ncbi:MAG: hypothetical protein KBA30_03190 [Clostridia bacterium]|nr:hypothetical protein [Clostridia bacterium]